MEAEEKARFDYQVKIQQRKSVDIANKHLKLQALPIGNPDPVPKPHLRKKKAHGLADARELSAHEIGAPELKAREALDHGRTAVTWERAGDDNAILLVADTPPGPPRPAGESQGGTSITLAIRSPEPLFVAPPPPWHAGLPLFRLPSEEVETLSPAYSLGARGRLSA